MRLNTLFVWMLFATNICDILLIVGRKKVLLIVELVVDDNIEGY